METIQNPYFSVELSESQINYLRERTRKILQENLEIKDFRELENPHISLTYILGEVKFKTVEEAAAEITETPFKMKVVGFRSIDSEFYGGTIVSLGLEHSDDFLYSQEFLKANFQEDNPAVRIKEYKGGFVAHLSLFVLNQLSERDKFLLPRYLELCMNDLSNYEVQGEKFCMYDPDRNKLFERQFKI